MMLVPVVESGFPFPTAAHATYLKVRYLLNRRPWEVEEFLGVLLQGISSSSLPTSLLCSSLFFTLLSSLLYSRNINTHTTPARASQHPARDLENFRTSDLLLIPRYLIPSIDRPASHPRQPCPKCFATGAATSTTVLSPRKSPTVSQIHPYHCILN